MVFSCIQSIVLRIIVYFSYFYLYVEFIDNGFKDDDFVLFGDLIEVRYVDVVYFIRDGVKFQWKVIFCIY